MKAVFIILSFLLMVAIIKSNDVPSAPSDGPVTVIMENLALNTAQITDEIEMSLALKFERSAADVLGNIEVITAAAMEQLGEAVFQAHSKLPTCPQNWTMPQLFKRIDDQLTNCTTNLHQLRTVFQGESQTLLQGLQSYVSQLSNLPAQCALLNGLGSNGVSSDSFASSTACFVQLLAELNRNVSQLVAQANTVLVRTRQSTRAGVTSATICTTEVVNEFANFLNEAFKNC